VYRREDCPAQEEALLMGTDHPAPEETPLKKEDHHTQGATHPHTQEEEETLDRWAHTPPSS